ncbi:MAG: hypothetical protein IKS93_05430 [Methanobrevibacter sp.]|nr:hypothetical protein [Methanobrevibacter sp.]
MTQWQSFKNDVYEKTNGKHGARFMIRCFGLDEDTGILVVDYNKGKDLILNIDPEEFADVYAFERELKAKKIIAEVPQKEEWGELPEHSGVYTLIKNHMEDFGVVRDNHIKAWCEYSGGPEELFRTKLKKASLERDGIYIISKNSAADFKGVNGFGVFYHLEYDELTEKELELIDKPF